MPNALKAFDFFGFYCYTSTYKIAEVYRSGHNEAVLKTVWVKAHGGSNPSASATKQAIGLLFALSSVSGLFKSCGFAARTPFRGADASLLRLRYESLRLRQTESRLNPRLCYFCIKGVAGIIINTEVYVPQWSDFYLTQKRDEHGNYTK